MNVMQVLIIYLISRLPAQQCCTVCHMHTSSSFIHWYCQSQGSLQTQTQQNYVITKHKLKLFRKLNLELKLALFREKTITI